MRKTKQIKPDAVFRIWDSTKELLELASWLPEVVGTPEELIRIGSVPVVRLCDDANPSEEPEVKPDDTKFIDADVSKYRNLSALFRKKHAKPKKAVS